MTTVITVSSIRGGVGKSSLSLELSLLLTTKGKTLLIDTDFFAPTLFNEIRSREEDKDLTPKFFTRDILKGLCTIRDAVERLSANFSVIFSDPKVNLWELSSDVGTKEFWMQENSNEPSQAEDGLAKIKEYTDNNSFDYIVFDSMAGMSYPVIFFSYLSNHPIFLARPSHPQIMDVINFINLIGTPDKPLNLIWSNVPNTGSYMKSTRQELEQKLHNECDDRYNLLGYIPRDPEFEKGALEGSLTLIPGALNSIYYKQLIDIMNSILE